jgi:RND family efflux transporter MFP subunit
MTSRSTVVLAILGVTVASIAGPPSWAETLGPSRVSVSPVIERQITASRADVGVVVPSRSAIIASSVAGRVVECPLDAGARVERDQTLVRLRADGIQLELAAASAELELRRQRLAELDRGPRPKEVERAQARLLGAEARMKHLDTRRMRVEWLFDSNRSVSQEERDQAVAAAAEATQAYFEMKAGYQLAVEGPPKEQVAQARAEAQRQEAVVRRLDDQVSQHTVRAPFAGYVIAERTEVGQWVNPGDPVAEVAALDEVDIAVDVAEEQLPHLRVGMSVPVQVPALPGLLLSGELCAVIPRANTRERTFPIRVRIKNQLTGDAPLVKAGMRASVALPTGTHCLARLVPKDALVPGGPEPAIVVLDGVVEGASQGTARMVFVRLGASVGGLVEVAGAVEPGQLVVVKGKDGLRSGQTVAIERVIGVGSVPEDDRPHEDRR